MIIKECIHNWLDINICIWNEQIFIKWNKEIKYNNIIKLYKND